MAGRGDDPMAAIAGANEEASPAELGARVQAGMGAARRHALGAHYTAEADVLRVVAPTLTRPLLARVAAASTRAALLGLHAELTTLRVLDPACGAGEFLRVALAELVAVEAALLGRLREHPGACPRPGVGVHQLFGIDVDPLAAALTRRTLLRVHAAHADAGSVDLDAQVLCGDALFMAWPHADIILGNPPFQAKNRMRAELGAAYVQRLRRRYPDVPGRADYCVYWFRRAHDELPAGGRAGLIGTNTIRQNDSRRGGLAHIVAHGGVITEAVATQPWPGAAAVHVSIVHWLKGAAPGPKRLSWQDGDRVDGPWSSVIVDEIGPSLAPDLEVGAAGPLRANVASGACYQGQTHGHAGFLLTPEEARPLLRASRRDAEVIFPFLIAEDLLGSPDGAPGRHVIDFGDRDLHAASAYRAPFAHVKARVLPDREQAAERERERNEAVLREDPEARVNRHHAVFLGRWWWLSWGRGELLARLEEVPRYIACAQVTRRPIFEFVAAAVRPNAALIVFPLADDYSFGVLQSQLHWQWFVARCSTLKGDYRYTSATVFDAFPWPQSPTRAQVNAVARASVKIRALRRSLLAQHGLSRREIYRLLDGPGRSPLADAHASLDLAVRAAYGIAPDADGLAALLDLNLTLAAQEAAGRPVQGPGVPPCVADPASLVSGDAVGPRS